MWLLAWLAGLTVLMCVRWLGVQSYRRRRPDSWSYRMWALAAVIQAGLLGTVWGVVGMYLARHGDPFQNNMLVCASLCIAMGALANVAFWPAHFAFQVPLLLLEAIGFATSSGPGALYLAGGLVISCAALSVLGPRLGAHVTYGFRLAAEKRALLEGVAAKQSSVTPARGD